MSGSSKENVPSKGSHQRPTPEMTTVTPRVTRSSSRRVRFSDDSGVSVVPFTPDLENSASFAVKAEKMVRMLLIHNLNCLEFCEKVLFSVRSAVLCFYVRSKHAFLVNANLMCFNLSIRSHLKA